jgi:hypothetical protein
MAESIHGSSSKLRRNKGYLGSKKGEKEKRLDILIYPSEVVYLIYEKVGMIGVDINSVPHSSLCFFHLLLAGATRS